MMTNTLARIDTEAETIRELTRRVQAEYAEMPGLSVTLHWNRRPNRGLTRVTERATF